MDEWTELSQTTTGRPVFLDGENELQLQRGVALYDRNEKTVYSEVNVMVTTHRLFIISNIKDTPHKAIQLSLANITELDTAVIKLWSMKESPKIGLRCKSGCYYRLSFRKGGRDNILLAIRKSLRNRAWKNGEIENRTKSSIHTHSDKKSYSTTDLQPTKPITGHNSFPNFETKEEKEFSTKHAGVGGILRKKNEISQTTDEQLKTAFKDIDALMVQAKNMVDLSKNLSKMCSDQNADLRNFMISMGIDNPVTKESTGAQYHSELAKQLSDFMMNILPTTPGEIIPLAQVYCLYNRARGTSLISPEDLYRSCVLMDTLGLPVILREFSSGVRALQPRIHSDNEFCKRIEKLLDRENGVTALFVAEEFGISLTLAKEQLLLAEQQELLCRDDSLQGLIFHKNFFKDY